jgi:kumamolisin
VFARADLIEGGAVVSGFGRGRRLLVLTVGIVVLAACVRHAEPAADPSPEPNLIGGPYGRLLSGSADLGPAHDRRVQLTVALTGAGRPAALIAWAQRNRLSVRWRPGDDWAYVEGAPGDVGTAFGVAVHDYRSPDGQVFYAAAQRPAIPESARDEIAGLGRISSYNPLRPLRPPFLPLDVPDPGLSPTQLIETYNAAPLRASGKGQTILIFAIDGYKQSDLDKFTAKFDLPPLKPQMVGSRLEPGAETPMDLELIHAIAPAAKKVVINLVDGYDGSTPVFAHVAAKFEAADLQFPGALWSLSLGIGCDRMATAADLRPVQSALDNAIAHGTSAFISSGDTGGLECKWVRANDDAKYFTSPPDELDKGVNAVGALPSITDIGGTTLSTDKVGGWIAEVTWVNSAMSQGTGGGVSTLFDRPDWQRTVSSPEDATHRLTPDVSAVADPYTGVSIVIDGELSTGGGTSQSAPIWAGLTALMNEYLASQGGRQIIDINPLLYRVAAEGSRPSFHDVTTGGNAVDNAAVGYDLVTGLGTPDTFNLVSDILDIQRAGG